ncbi:hypothetical protein AQUSIP_19290 [Aquicella siphonis]|uniref:Thiol-disulfide oxidoreductase DCC n=1 Tax=Aquicella siphonis TaxID=254247 RepID=A0A5E4PK21_9COXI|nr:DCC1-like thiol-disulfide oxidoreductase family protein [Aquicella siphonis]VVC76606.1 hypothetical protein AQUSIP_19290 [Aquicella siphonis]
MSQAQQSVLLIYDGDCPLCDSFAKMIKIRESVGHFEMINARQPHPVLDEINAKKLDLDQGVVVKYNNHFYHGPDAMHILGLMSSDHDWFNCFNALLFRSKIISRLFYPLFKYVRNGLLWWNGVPKIKNLGGSHESG